MKRFTHPQHQRNRHANRGEAGKNTHCPFVAKGIKHGSTEQGENCSTDATQDDGSCSGAGKVNFISIHEIGCQTLEDLGDSSAKRDSSKDGNYPWCRGLACPIAEGVDF